MTTGGPVFIGMDAMDPRLVRALAEDGRLPVLAGLLADWDAAPTSNPLGLVVGGLWPSFWSGVGPAHHGSYCFRQVVPGGWETSQVRPTDIDTPTFWAPLDADGYRCTVFDVPLLAPRPLRNGRVIGDWGTHDRQLDFTCWPSEVTTSVLTTAGPHPIDDGRCDALVEQHGHTRLRGALHDAIERRTDLLVQLLGDDDDLVLAVFSEAHCAGHHFWHLHDRAHPAHDPAVAAALGGDPLAEVYERLDAALGHVLAAVGDRPVMVLLSHGIGAHDDGNHLLDEVLARVERAHFDPVGMLTRARAAALPYARAASRHVRRRTGRGAQPVPRSIGRLDGSRRWYQVPNNDLYGGIRLNLRGREPRGLVQPGPEADRISDLLTSELLTLRNEETGRPAVREVVRCDDHHTGPRRHWLPDLFVAWDWTAPLRAVSSPTIGVVEATAAHVRTGDHRPSGMVLSRRLPLVDERPIPVERLATSLVEAVRRTGRP